MDEKIKEILTEKLNHILNQNEDIEKLISCFENVNYNSFYTEY